MKNCSLAEVGCTVADAPYVESLPAAEKVHFLPETVAPPVYPWPPEERENAPEAVVYLLVSPRI